jgi:plastocyanin
MGRILVVVALLLAVVFLAASRSSAGPVQETTLLGSIGDSGITVRDAQGTRVTRLDPGSYRLEVDDQSDFHNFHLQGPGVDVATGVEFVGRTSFTVNLADGSYIYICDVHPISLRGSFTVGNPPPPAPAPAPAPAPKPPSGVVTPASKLFLTSGPGFTITLKTSAGATVKKLKTGTYTTIVRDRARIHDAHLVGPGFDKRTTVPFTGTQTWKVKLAKPGTLRFLCDPHASQGMRGSARIVR